MLFAQASLIISAKDVAKLRFAVVILYRNPTEFPLVNSGVKLILQRQSVDVLLRTSEEIFIPPSFRGSAVTISESETPLGTEGVEEVCSIFVTLLVWANSTMSFTEIDEPSAFMMQSSFISFFSNPMNLAANSARAF
jgi:hypothetical protein